MPLPACSFCLVLPAREQRLEGLDELQIRGGRDVEVAARLLAILLAQLPRGTVELHALHAQRRLELRVKGQLREGLVGNALERVIRPHGEPGKKGRGKEEKGVSRRGPDRP